MYLIKLLKIIKAIKTSCLGKSKIHHQFKHDKEVQMNIKKALFACILIAVLISSLNVMPAQAWAWSDKIHVEVQFKFKTPYVLQCRNAVLQSTTNPSEKYYPKIQHWSLWGDPFNSWCKLTFHNVPANKSYRLTVETRTWHHTTFTPTSRNLYVAQQPLSGTFYRTYWLPHP